MMGRAIVLGAFALSSFVVLSMVAGTDDGDARSRDERGRIEAHLARAAQRLDASPPEDLTPEQQAARQVTLSWLDEYRAAGIFPHNHVRPDARTPIFVDPHGTPCAVGYLLLRSGEDALVEEIVRTNNLVRVPELRDDPRLARWLDARGITLEEAALIQPQYGDPPPDLGVQSTSDYVPVTVGLSLATAALVSYTAMAGTDSGEPLVDALLIGAALGHTYLLASDDSGDHGTSAGFNALGVLASVGTEIVRLMARGDDGRAPRSGFSARVAPGVNGTEIGLLIRH